MFNFLKKRERTEHLKLLRQLIEMAEELASYTERVARSGLDTDGSAIKDARIFRHTIDDLTPILHELEAKENEKLPPETVQPLLNLWKDFRLRLDVIRKSEKAARARFKNMYRD